MKFYAKMAEEYFQHFEGLHLYPSWRDFRIWIWAIVTALWFFCIFLTIHMGMLTSPKGFSLIIFPEILWLFMTFLIKSKKEEKIISATKQYTKLEIKSVSDCRLLLLKKVLNRDSSEFLEISKEIRDIIDLTRNYRRRHEPSWEEFWKNFYDSESKGRLLTLVIVLVSSTVALSVKDGADISVVFDFFSNHEGQKFMLSLVVIAIIMFLAFIGLRSFFLMMIDILISWSVVIFRGGVFSKWVLSYLARDLVYFHRQNT